MELPLGEVYTYSTNDYICILKIKNKSILVSRDGLTLVIQHGAGVFEEFYKPSVASATFRRLSLCKPSQIKEGDHTVQLGFVQKALYITRDSRDICSSQKRTLKWAERYILHAELYILKCI